MKGVTYCLICSKPYGPLSDSAAPGISLGTRMSPAGIRTIKINGTITAGTQAA